MKSQKINLLLTQIGNLLKKLLKPRRVTILFWIVAILFVALAVVGAVRNYSPVPFWDMWAGYLGFFSQISGGDFSSLWAQHNEHRIFLSRVLFWLDISFFAGSGLFLIVLNYLFPLAAFAIFFFCIKEILKSDDSTTAKNIVGAAILILLFSWVQKENFNWAFQSQFFLAQLLPLLSFFLLHKSCQSRDHSTSLFLLACATGVLCAGTMANGVAALPVMVLLSLVLRMSLKRVVVLIALSSLVIATYFYNYTSPGHHGSLREAILQNPLGLIQYILCYLGNPLHHVSSLVSQIVGSMFIFGSVLFAFKYFRQGKMYSLQLSLIAFILYVGITAVATGGGRLIFGLEQAFSSRYATPVLMAWSALLVICAPIISTGLRKNVVLVAFFLILVPATFLPKQLHVFDSNEGVFDSKIAALALEIGVKDEEQLKRIYPDEDALITIAKKPIERNLSIFGNPVIKDVRQLIGTEEVATFTTKCLGNLDAADEIDGEENYVGIEGWVFNSSAESAPEIVHVVDEDKKIVGYALTGKKRTDIKKSVNNKAKFSGFKGYLLKNAVGKKVILNGINPDCSLTLEANLTK